jgi:hypothetical protein
VGGGLACVALGLLLFPDSNLAGGLALVGAPFAWIGAVMLFVFAVASAVERWERRRHARRDPERR